MHPVTSAGVLAGRAGELALFDGYLRDLARGDGSAVLIEGEPGIGKTTLVRTALASLSGLFGLACGGSQVPVSVDARPPEPPRAPARPFPSTSSSRSVPPRAAPMPA